MKNTEQLTCRRRLLGALTGEEVDRTPFSPFLAYYFGHLEPAIQRRGMLAYLQEMGADPLLRGSGFAFTVTHSRCSREETVRGCRKLVTCHTPYGDLTAEYTYSPDGNTWFITRYPVTTPEELKRLEAYFRDLQIHESIAAYNELHRRFGEDALDLPLIGVNMKSAYQSLLEEWAGTENLVYLTMDAPDALENTLEAMQEKNQQTVCCTLFSDADGAIFWEDSSTTNLSPALYDRYIRPEITGWATQFRESGKLLVQHACGHIRDLLPLMAAQGIHAIESLTPEPTGNLAIDHIWDSIPEEIAVVGGIDPTVLLSSSLEELRDYAARLLELGRGRRFILANSDSCPPHVDYEKFRLLVRLVKDRG